MNFETFHLLLYNVGKYGKHFSSPTTKTSLNKDLLKNHLNKLLLLLSGSSGRREAILIYSLLQPATQIVTVFLVHGQ